MIKPEPVERRSADEKVWSELGNYGARLTNLEAGQIQVGQALINHRAETDGDIKDFKGEVKELISDFRTDFKELIGKVGHIQYFMYFSYGATAAVGAMFALLVYWDNIKHFFIK